MKYLKLFEDYKSIEIAIGKIQELNFLDSEDEPIDPVKKNIAIEFVKKQFDTYAIVPYFIAPTVYWGVLVEYTNNDVRIDLRFEDSEDNLKEMIIFKSGKGLYNDVFDREKFNFYLNLS
jgi:hypothetical protein